MKNLGDYISNWLKNYALERNIKGFVLGVSGGIDSAVSSTLCAKTGLKTIVLTMPIYQKSAEVGRAEKHIDFLKKNFSNVSSADIDLTNSFDELKNSLQSHLQVADEERQFLTLANTRSRLRMATLYAISGVNQLLVCGTGNKVEDFGVGFYTKYGDGGVDIIPIADLMKSEVYALGKELGVIEEILIARPTDGLWDDGRTDEDQIGATYDELEWAMLWVEKNDPTDENLSILNSQEQKVMEIYLRFHRANKHKMEDIPVCKIPRDE